MAIPGITRWIALLRGINVGGHRKLPMAELRDLCADLGWQDVQTFIQSGNVVFSEGSDSAVLERNLEQAIRSRYGFDVPVILRTAQQWRLICDGNPFPGASAKEPNLVLACFSRFAFPDSAAAEIEARGTQSERAILSGDTLWIHFAGGSGRSKITPAVLDRQAGTPVTTRNWRTIVKINEMIN
jgi:uncharacterized protein (DUF1697 family)